MATAAEALADITTGMTVQQLRDLAATVNADVGSSTLLLYSGGVGTPTIIDSITGEVLEREFGAKEISLTLADGTTVKTIANTQIAQFLEDPIFEQALFDAVNTPGYNGPSYSELLDGKIGDVRVNSTSFWVMPYAIKNGGQTLDCSDRIPYN